MSLWAGTTSQSCNIRLLLASICWQIVAVYERDTVNLPTDYPSLVAHFHSLLSVSSTLHRLFRCKFKVKMPEMFSY